VVLSGASEPALLRILFLLPFPPDLAGTHGGARATAEIIDMLSRKHDVSVLYLEPEGSRPIQVPPGGVHELTGIHVDAAPATAKAAWRRIIDAVRWLLWDIPGWVEESFSEPMVAAIARRAAEFRPDVVHCEFHVMAQYIPVLRRVAPGTRCVVTEHEVGVVAAADHGNERRGFRRWLGSIARERAWARFERRALSKADAVVAFTEKDCAAVRALIGTSGPEIECIPLRLRAAPVHADTRGAPIPSDLLFVGNFKHPPNNDAAMRLVTAIFPAVRDSVPGTTLYIVGADPPEELTRAQEPGLFVTGWVESPEPYLAGAKLVLVPLRQGGGMRVKVIEACTAGKAVIASSLAVEGLGLRPDVEFVLANSDEEFIRSAIDLLGDAERRERLGEAARQWALRTQGSEEWLSQYEALYARLGAQRVYQRV
jgi:glycosyltransferase involved in cell wall biosynthesis